MVEEVWRYPLKSAQGESVRSLRYSRQGPAGDHSWACLDSNGLVVSAKHPRRWGKMLHVRARTLGQDVLVQVPGVGEQRAGSPHADAALSGWLGTDVTLSRTMPANPRLHRLYPREAGLRASWVADDDEDTVTPLGGGHLDRFVDFAPVHIVTKADLLRVSRDGAPNTEVRRFRPNLVLDLAAALLPGDHVRLSGGLELKVTLPTPRCAVPACEQPGLAAAPAVLVAIGKQRTRVPGLGTAACVGVYAEVLTPGTASVGELVFLNTPG